MEDSTILFSGGTTRTHGVALLLREHAKRSLKSWLPISPRLLTARLTHRHGHLSIVVAYAPTEGSSTEDKDNFYDQLYSIFCNIPPHDQLVLIGDFNAVTGTSRIGFETVIGNFGSGIPNDNTHRLLPFCATYGLSILGSWFQRRNIHRFTWISNDGHTTKEIDHIITRDRKLFTSCRAYRGAECSANTDHHLVIAKMQLRLSMIQRTASSSVRYDTDRLLKDTSLMHRYCLNVSNKFEVLSSFQGEVDEVWSAISSAIHESAEEIVGKKRTTHKPWLSNNAYQIIQRKYQARITGNSRERNRLKRLFDKQALKDKENFYNNIADEAEQGLTRNDLKTTYRAIKTLSGSTVLQSHSIPIKDSFGSPCNSEDTILERWAEHYEKMLNHPSAKISPELDDLAAHATPDPNVKEDASSLNEVKMAIKKLKNGRAPGPDDIPAELLKCAMEPVSKALHKLFCKVWESGMIPSEWRNGIVISLYKGKGPRLECSSYRPITLLSVPGKIFAHILLARIEPLLHNKRRIEQSSFTKCRSTLDAILALRLLSELHREFQRPLHVAYIDLKAAFDSVDRSALWKALQGIGVPKILLNLIRELHNGTAAKIRLGQKLSRSFQTSSGVRQGCVLAPALFCRAMDFIMERVSKKIGIQVGSTLFTDTNYADDAALLIDDQQQYEMALKTMEEESSKLGLHVSWEKTKIQNLGYGPPDPPIIINNETVETVTAFTYLGSILSSCSNSSDESQRRIGLASSVMKSLSRIWNQKKLSLSTKIRIYSAYVLPVLLYGSESWTLAKAYWSKLQAFHTRCPRRILRIKWNDFISNDKVKDRTGMKDLDTIIRRRRLGLFGHIARLPANVPAKQALTICCQTRDGIKPNSEWKRPRGRPYKTWVHQVCGDTGTSATESMHLAHDRKFWRTIATADSSG